MIKPPHVQITMKVNTLRVLLFLFGHTTTLDRRIMGVPEKLNQDASDFYAWAKKELSRLGYNPP